MTTDDISVGTKVRHAVSVAAGVIALWGAERLCYLFMHRLGVQFPSSVGGMLAAFGGLLVLRSALPRVGVWVANALAPARLFLTRWMALFFVPPLVQLPLNELPGFGDLAGCLVVVGGGFCANLWVTGWVASRGAPTHRPHTHTKVTAVVWSRRFILWLWSIVALVSLVLWLNGVHVLLLGFGIGAAVLGFVLAEWGRELLVRRGLVAVALVFHPVLASACFAGVAWRATGQTLNTYLYHGADATFAAPGNWLMALLSPAVVALGLVLDTERGLLQANVRPLLGATITAALFSLSTSAVLSRLLDLSQLYARALLPRAVTTPVALVIARMFDGNLGLTAGFVVLSGVLGALFAAPLLRRFGFGAPFPRGVATGASSHGIGTAALVRDDPQAAAFSAISFALVAAFSVTFSSLGPFRSFIEWVLAY